MDYVPAHGNTAQLDDREDTSGARVFDGEDQGRCTGPPLDATLLGVLAHAMDLVKAKHDLFFFRLR